jgi:hypothetical protein
MGCALGSSSELSGGVFCDVELENMLVGSEDIRLNEDLSAQIAHSLAGRDQYFPRFSIVDPEDRGEIASPSRRAAAVGTRERTREGLAYERIR